MLDKKELENEIKEVFKNVDPEANIDKEIAEITELVWNYSNQCYLDGYRFAETIGRI